VRSPAVLEDAMIAATDRSRASLEVARNLFSEPELWRLLCVEATFAAEHCLVPVDEPCPDHLACRRLAFGLWLRLTGRVSDDLEN
jgi:hypothetical protein